MNISLDVHIIDKNFEVKRYNLFFITLFKKKIGRIKTKQC